MNGKVKYIEVNYKYRLAEAYVIQTAIRPMKHIATDYAVLGMDGVLIIDKGFSWDGASGPAVDTKSMIRASLLHDCLYRLMKDGFLSLKWRKAADKEFRRIYSEDVNEVKRPWYSSWIKHLGPARAWWAFKGVREFGRSSAARCKQTILEAP